MKKQTIQEPKISVPIDSIPRLAYTPAEAGAAIGRDKSWVYRQIYRGNLRVSASFGKRAMIPAAELERFVRDRRHHRSEGAGFLRWVLCTPGNITQVRWERHPLGDDGVELRAFARRSRKLIAVPY